MQIPNTFKLRTGAIQLADIDANFDVIQVTVNQQADTITTMQANIASLVTQIANFSAIPIGCIIMWSGSISTIPSGWRLCDGTNNTPDLRDKFVIGARSDSTYSASTFVTAADTKTGGNKDSVVVLHGHTATSTATSSGSMTSDSDSWTATITGTDTGFAVSGSAYLTGGASNRSNSTNQVFEYDTFTISHSHAHTHTPTISTVVSTTVTDQGTSGTNRNLPPYYSLAFIMKT